jgi:hypothetical protein
MVQAHCLHIFCETSSAGLLSKLQSHPGPPQLMTAVVCARKQAQAAHWTCLRVCWSCDDQPFEIRAQSETFNVPLLASARPDVPMSLIVGGERELLDGEAAGPKPKLPKTTEVHPLWHPLWAHLILAHFAPNCLPLMKQSEDMDDPPR